MSLDNGLSIICGNPHPSCSFDYYESMFPQLLFELLTSRLFPLATLAKSGSFLAAHGGD